jgi:hypothetical protein
MIFRSVSRSTPEKSPINLADTDVIDAGLASSHQAFIRELPELIAI